MESRVGEYDMFEGKYEILITTIYMAIRIRAFFYSLVPNI